MRKKNRKLNIQLLFILTTMLEILGTLGVSALLSALLSYLMQTSIQVHPLVWLCVFGITIGLTVSVIVNLVLLRPIVRLSKAMKQVADGDFTIRLQAESSIQEIHDSYHSFNLMVQELEATETLQSDFVSNVSHEFKTPINAIEGYATLLQDTSSPQEQQRYIERILLNTCRLSTLVGNILLLSRVSNNAIPAAKTTYRLDEQIRQVIMMQEPQWSKKDVNFDIELDSVSWTGNEGLMMHVWSNLLSNAVKFNPQNGLVRMRLHQDKGSVIFSIEDRGPGIPEAQRKHVFQRFFQLDSSHKQEGNGLGLALCKQIIDGCGGSIAVESVLEGGSRFIVQLPSQKQRNADA